VDPETDPLDDLLATIHPSMGRPDAVCDDEDDLL